jgi:hypothetical protein
LIIKRISKAISNQKQFKMASQQKTPNELIEQIDEDVKYKHQIFPRLSEGNCYYKQDNINIISLHPENLKEYFKPIVLTEPIRYQCPSCRFMSGTMAPKDPENRSLFPHQYNCQNKLKFPKE